VGSEGAWGRGVGRSSESGGSGGCEALLGEDLPDGVDRSLDACREARAKVVIATGRCRLRTDDLQQALGEQATVDLADFPPV
jgi:hypothetical protein